MSARSAELGGLFPFFPQCDNWSVAGVLYLVPTPIGNLEDISRRCLRVLGEVDLIACEDTRHTRKLLEHYGIKNRMISYHEHNEDQRVRTLISELMMGKDVAVVSDAGTPGINDPGFRLVRKAVANGIKVTSLPGPTAFATALVASGLPTDQFYFGGFLPGRSSQRRAHLEELRLMPATLVFYEAPHRILKSLIDAREVLGERRAAVAREITKVHEEILRGRLTELIEEFGGEQKPRGEMVLLIDREILGEPPSEKSKLSTLVASYESQGLSSRAALKRASRDMGLDRDEAYRRLAIERKGKS